jgi:methyl-accepting chemotaxis protein
MKLRAQFLIPTLGLVMISMIASLTISMMSGNMDTVAAATREAAEAISMLATSAEERSATVAEITRNISQSSAVATQIAEEIQTVDSASSQMSASSDDIQQTAVGLAGMAKQLNALVSRFKA